MLIMACNIRLRNIECYKREKNSWKPDTYCSDTIEKGNLEVHAGNFEADCLAVLSCEKTCPEKIEVLKEIYGTDPHGWTNHSPKMISIFNAYGTLQLYFHRKHASSEQCKKIESLVSDAKTINTKGQVNKLTAVEVDKSLNRLLRGLKPIVDQVRREHRNSILEAR